MLFVDIIGRNRGKLCGMSTLDVRSAVGLLALLTEENRTSVKRVDMNTQFMKSSMIR